MRGQKKIWIRFHSTGSESKYSLGSGDEVFGLLQAGAAVRRNARIAMIYYSIAAGAYVQVFQGFVVTTRQSAFGKM